MKGRIILSVKKKDRHQAKNECLGKSRVLTHQALIITRPPKYDRKTGKVIQKAGLLGEGQPLQAFGLDILRSAKAVHAYCYDASKINLKNEETLNERTMMHRKAIEHCRSILRQIDLCIFEYARDSKKKRKSFNYLAPLIARKVRWSPLRPATTPN